MIGINPSDVLDDINAQLIAAMDDQDDIKARITAATDPTEKQRLHDALKENAHRRRRLAAQAAAFEQHHADAGM